MKIISVSPIWFHMGEGISEVVKNHHLTFKKLGVESQVIQTNYNQSSTLPINNKSLHESINSDLIKVGSLMSLIRGLYRLRGGVFIIHGIFQPKILISMFYLWVSRQKYIVIPHSSLSGKAYTERFFLKNLVYNIIIKFLLKKSFFVMYLNDDEKLNGIYKGKNVEVFNNGVSLPVKTNVALDKQLLSCDSIGGDSVNLIYFGRYDIKHKGIDYLLRFVNFIELNKPDFDWTLNFYGSVTKNGLEFINNFVHEHNLSHRIKVNHAVYGYEKEQALSSADVFILSSRYEGMPIAVLEALSNGLPCLLTKETNMLDSLLNYGVAEEFYVDDFEKTFSSLSKLSDKGCREKIRSSCYSLVEKKYSWDIVCKNILHRIISKS